MPILVKLTWTKSSRKRWGGRVANNAGCSGYERIFIRIDFTTWRAGRFEIVIHSQQIDELKRASRYAKFRAVLQPHRVGQIIKNLQRAFVLDRLPEGPETADPHDAFLLAMAIAASADYLVTGDHRAGILGRAHIGRTRIMAPSAFCSAVL